ncbi:MAG: phospholipase D family protein [Rhodobacteraceae bacterium]|nr:phospholipase D family protein [Paracoccaceae bacterium]
MVLIRTLCAAALLAGCTYVPFDAPRTKSELMPASRDSLTLGLEGITATRSAFFTLEDGNDALGARLRMIENAQSSIDIKTFLIKPDLAGSLVSLELYAAANRGVRVRLLIDDVFTTTADDDIAALDAHPNIEIRMFNPASRRSPQFVGYALDFNRLNRRMHNKAFIVDGQAAIIGGRNIADEYYSIGQASEFADFDMFAAGPVVAPLAEGFQTYWDDPWSIPIAALKPGGDDSDLASALQSFDETASTEAASIYRRAIESTYLADIRNGRIQPIYGEARVDIDPPQKLRLRQGGDQQVAARALFTAMDRASSDVLVITPYFVPEEYGVDFLTQIADRGTRVRVVTNSLAATNHPYVHAGYAPRRAPLLAAGVELFEVRPDPLTPDFAPAPEDAAPLTMHTKLAVIDDRYVWVGSMNYDPRAVKLNSELGVLIDAPELAEEISGRIEAGKEFFTWRPQLDDDGSLIWIGRRGQDTVATNVEPDASGLDKFVATVTGWLPVEGQL